VIPNKERLRSHVEVQAIDLVNPVSYEERVRIAETLGMTTEAVKSALHQLRKEAGIADVRGRGCRTGKTAGDPMARDLLIQWDDAYTRWMGSEYDIQEMLRRLSVLHEQTRKVLSPE
jgi:hypothetical protein